MERPLITILIPVYNGANYLREAIDSALGQTYENCEVIVVNDGSKDGGQTRRIAQSYGTRIRYFEKPNGGVAQALNFGVQQMRGEYFSWLSHDDVLCPAKIEQEWTALKETDASFVFCSYSIIQENGDRALVRLADHFSREYLERGIFPVLHSLIQFGGVLFHKSLLERYGGFREDLKTTQDFEFLFRVLKQEKSVYLDEPLYAIRYHAQQGSHTIQSVKRDADEMYLMFLRGLEDAQRRAVFGSTYNYYYRMYLQIWPQAHLEKSLAECRRRLAEHRRSAVPGTEAKACLEPYLNGKTIYIYGCGNYGRRLKRDLELRGYSVTGFVDGNAQLWGRYIDGSMCISLDSLKPDQNILVILASIYVDEIAQECRKHTGLQFILKKQIDEAGMDFPPEGTD